MQIIAYREIKKTLDTSQKGCFIVLWPYQESGLVRIGVRCLGEFQASLQSQRYGTDQSARHGFYWFSEAVRSNYRPDLFMSADQGLRSVSGEKDIARIKELLPQLQIIHVPGAGHSIRRDQFVSHMEVVEQFLAGLQRFG